MKKNTCVLMTLTLTAALSSCAGPESYHEKMSRYSPKQSIGKYTVPQIDTQGFQFKTKSVRSPASADSTGTSVEKISSEETTLSNKKLYFLTLFGQYESMKKYAQEFEVPSVNICPHFHTGVLEHKSRKPAGAFSNVAQRDGKKFSYDTKRFNEPDYVASRPELSLPLSKDSITPKVIDIFRSEKVASNDAKMDEIVHKALDIHLSKTYSEIRELCEFGVSDNYYIYENLITHIKNSDFKPATANMNTLLKTTIFSNIALVTSLDKIQATPMRSIASVGSKSKEALAPYANEVMSRLSVEWAKEYFDHIKTSK
ncbi:MAG: hypothetical protein H7336_01810 [Bacteriovorax sp.]|nr:hypothetical protein [Bacteriovorax sp.]